MGLSAGTFQVMGWVELEGTAPPKPPAPRVSACSQSSPCTRLCKTCSRGASPGIWISRPSQLRTPDLGGSRLAGQASSS